MQLPDRSPNFQVSLQLDITQNSVIGENLELPLFNSYLFSTSPVTHWAGEETSLHNDVWEIMMYTNKSKVLSETRTIIEVQIMATSTERR